MTDPVKVLVAGDFHGNGRWAELTIQHAKRLGADTIVQVGDFGFWVSDSNTRHYLKIVKNTAKNFGVHFYWLDGNHEDHSRRQEFSDYNTEWFTYLPRGHRWTWWGKRFMSVGGAVSVDKHMRTQNKSWWPEETLTDDEVAYCCRNDGTPVDVVFAHDCASGVAIPGMTVKEGLGRGWPHSALMESEQHRGKLLTIWENIHPQKWFHGHYHVSYQLTVGHTHFVGLGCDGDKMYETVRLLAPEDLD